MAFDKSPVYNALIFKLMAAALVTLVSLKFILDSYFTYISEDAKAKAAASPEELIKLRAAEKKALSTAQTPLTEAMKIVANAPRERASLIVRPLPSDDVNSMKGWSKLPKAFDPELRANMSAVAPSSATATSSHEAETRGANH